MTHSRGLCGGCGCTSGACDKGCCAGVRTVTPRPAYERPGLPTLHSRIGTYGDFLETMKARLAAHAELDPLTVRTLDDPSMALLDCWSVVADTVTFYGERALTEGYLGTATQPDSVSRLGRLVGYRPRPSLGSSGQLAFTMEPGQVGSIPAGSSAKSVPGPDEQPQTFETSEDLEARAEWNQLAVRTTRPFAIFAPTVQDLEELTFVGASLNLKAGDLLVFDFGESEAPRSREIATVAPDFEADRTVVALVPEPGRRVGADRCVREVRDLAQSAAKDVSTPFQAELAALLSTAADELGDELSDDPELILPALSTLLRLVVEAQTLATEGRLSGRDVDWVARRLEPLAESVRTATPLAAAVTRGRSPELAYLDRLAAAITCPDPEVRLQGSTDCSTGAPLLATAAALGALRRPPSRPPASSAAAPQDLAAALAPRSVALTDLLAGTDPGLRSALSTATARLPVAGPRLTASVIALRTRANPVPEGINTEKAVSVDGNPENLVAGGWMVSRELVPREDGSQLDVTQLVTRIVDVQHFVRPVSLADGKTTVRVPTSVAMTAGPVIPHHGDVRIDVMTVWFGDQPLTLADERLLEPVGGAEIELAQPCPGLQPGRRLIVSGERSDVPGVTGVTASEVTMVAGVEQRVDLALPGDVARPVVVLAVPLAYQYVRETVVVHGNVVEATQGETRSEVLGSGQASQPGQSFALKQPTLQAPLTYLASVSATGAASTLEVRVDTVRWHPTDVLADHGARDRVYAVDEGPGPAVTVRFGDGTHGSRLPNGIENVTAKYRIGAGRSGNVGRDRVRQLTSRPLGVSGVSNPLPMAGGTRADSAADGRVVAPLRTLALDRLVSIADYADFAVAHAGIAKAAAARVYDGSGELVHVTVAAVDDAPLVPGDQLLTALEQTLAAYGDPHLPLCVGVRSRIRLVLSAGLKVDPDHLFEDVVTRVRTRLHDELGFQRARLGEPVYLSQVVAAVQATPGVDFVDVDAFGGLPDVVDPVRLLTDVTALSGVADVVTARPARVLDEEYIVGNDPTGEPDTLSTIALRHGLSTEELVRLNPRLRAVVLSDGIRLVVASGPTPAELAYFDPDQPQTLVLRRIP